MQNQMIKIWDGTDYAQDHSNAGQPTLTTYLLDDIAQSNFRPKRASVLICPGGAYRFVSDREAEPVAMRFLAAGFDAFILRYRVAPSARYPEPLLDLFRAMWLIRENAAKWNLDPDRIAVCGFSAGGHLAASLGVFWESPELRAAIGMPEGINQPDALILGYPVITSGAHAHKGSFVNLLGENAPEEIWNKMSLEFQVNKSTPPSFLWHTFSDQAVPVENSLCFVRALNQQGIPFELHVFPEGPHGLSLCDKETAVGNPSLINDHTAKWMPLCLEWLGRQFHEIG
ncbi:alpha/beta hydrolase [Eubacteriales bacterium mix99]|jgi:acetyl esterase/lipase|nr:acetylesterase [Clostridiales bacterium]